MNHEAARRISMETSADMLKKCIDAKMEWSEVAVVLETMIVTVIGTCALMDGSPDPRRFMQEIVDTMTESVHKRLLTAIDDGLLDVLSRRRPS